MIDIAGFTFDSFLYKYTIFLFFIIFLIGMGAGNYFGGNIADLSAPTPATPVESDNGLLDWLTNSANSISYFFNNIVFFFTLMSVDTGIGWMGILIFSPGVIIIFYNVLKLIRGGG